MPPKVAKNLAHDATCEYRQVACACARHAVGDADAKPDSSGRPSGNAGARPNDPACRCPGDLAPAPPRALVGLYIGCLSASPTAYPLRGYGRAGTQNDHLSEAVNLSTGTPIPAQWAWACRRQCRYRMIRHANVRVTWHQLHLAHSSQQVIGHGEAEAQHLRTLKRPNMTGCAITTYRHRRLHVYCEGMGVPVLKMPASERRSF